VPCNGRCAARCLSAIVRLTGEAPTGCVGACSHPALKPHLVVFAALLVFMCRLHALQRSLLWLAALRNDRGIAVEARGER
jgi:hypothetical protein